MARAAEGVTLAGEIIIKEGRTRKVSRETHLNRRKGERMGILFLDPNLFRKTELGTSREKKETRYHLLLTTKKLS